jgi:anaerobic selenocysteine-containing dehydrogenase
MKIGASLLGDPYLLDEAPPPVAINMKRKPTTDELLELMATGSRIPLAEVKRHPTATIFPSAMTVGPKDTGWGGRFNVGDADMMRDLGDTLREGDVAAPLAHGFDFRLLCRRVMHVVNSSANVLATNRGRTHNLAYLNPEDLVELGLAEYDIANITSAHGSISAVVAGDRGLRRGTVSMAHGYGGDQSEEVDVERVGSPAGRLIPVDVVYDRYSGQPLMSNVPVRVTPVQCHGTPGT